MGLLDSIKSAKGKYSRSGGDTYRLKEGKTRVRVIPFLGPNGKVGKFDNGSDGRFYAEVGVHWIKTQLNGKPVAVVGDCEIVYGRPSPINAAIAQAAEVAKKTDDEMVKLVADWKARKSVLMNALIRSGQDASDDNPVVLEISPTTHGKLLSAIETYMESVDNPEDILSADKGIDFIIERTGKNLDTEYSVIGAPTSKPIKKDVFDKIVDLDDFIAAKYFRGEEQKAINAIAAVTGISAPAVTQRTAPQLLTQRTAPQAPATAPETAPWEDAPAKVAQKAAEKVEQAPPTQTDDFGAALPESEVDAMLKELDEI